MELALIFNELSRNPKAPDKATARQWMQLFADVVKSAYDAKIKTLRTDFEFSRLELSDGYLIEMWFNDNDVPEPTRNFIQDLATTFQLIKPFADDLAEDDEAVQRKKDIFVTCFDETAEGLTYAYLLKSIGVSFLSHTKWDKDILRLIINELPEDADGFVISETDIKHITRTDHLTSHQDWIIERLKFSVGNGSVLLTKVKDWYPHLIFCNNAKKQIKALHGGIQLQRIVDRLFDLENYCRSWTTGGFSGVGIPNSSGESSLTMSQYGRDREFVCPDGKTRTFEYHLKGLPKAWRIHIWADEQEEFGLASSGNRKILVGYVGKHLSTANDPT